MAIRARLVALLGAAAVANARSLASHAPHRSLAGGDRHAVALMAMSAAADESLLSSHDSMQQQQRDSMQQQQRCQRLACLARLRGGEADDAEKVEGDCIGIDLGTTCAFPNA